MNRRDFLKGAGTVTVVAAAGGVWYAHDRGVGRVGGGPAYEPWTTWRTDATEGPLALVRAGILAANPHNTQPWLFHVTDSSVELLADTSRHLGAFDPYRREMFLGLGCALENMMLTAQTLGLGAELTLEEGSLLLPLEEGRPVRVAHVDLNPADPAPSPLFDAIPQRHTNRGPYEVDRTVPADLVEALARTEPEDSGIRVVVVVDPADRSRFGSLIIEATESIVADETMVHDSERWYRHSRSEIERHRDGPTLDAAGLHPLRAAVAKLLPRPSADDNHRYWLEATRDVHVPTAPLLGMIVVSDLYDRAQTLRAGRLWQRKHLLATTRGLAMQPLNQPVELVDRRRALGDEDPAVARALSSFIDEEGLEPTFVFRAGFPGRGASPSPRRPAAEVLI